MFRYLVKDDFLNHRIRKLQEYQNVFIRSFTVIGNDTNKLVCQTYNGASVMSGKNEDVQAKIQEKYHWEWFVHCQAHQVNLVVLKACSSNKAVCVFFFECGMFN